MPANTERLYDSVAERLGKSTTIIRRCSAWHQWQKRRTAFLSSLQEQVDKAVVKEIVKTAKKTVAKQTRDYAEWHLANIERATNIVDGLLNKTEEMLSLPVVTKSVQTNPIFGKNGEQFVNKDGGVCLSNRYDPKAVTFLRIRRSPIDTNIN